MSNKNGSSWLRCPWCGKQPVPIKRGRIMYERRVRLSRTY